MNQCVMPRNSSLGTARSFRFQTYAPASCSTERLKVSNLRTLVKDVEAQIDEVQRLGDKLEFLATGELVAAVIMETSVGFLDLAASAFAEINPAASRAAKAGVLAVKTTETAGQAATGQISVKKAAFQVADNSAQLTFSQLAPKGLAGKAALNQAKTAYDGAVLSIKAATGTNDKELRQEGLNYATSRLSENTGLIADGLKEGGMDTAGSTLKSLVVIGDMYLAGQRYQSALEQRFDTRLEQRESTQTWVMTQKMNLRNMLSNLRDQLSRAVTELESCTSGSA